MYTDKKRTKEDTWKPTELKRYIVDGSHKDSKKEDNGERRRDREKDRREEKDREKERERRREKDRGDKLGEYKSDKTDRRRDRAETRDRERDNHYSRDRDKARDKHTDEERERRRREREKEMRGEERDPDYKHNREKHDRERRERHRERDGHRVEYESSRGEKERRERPREKNEFEASRGEKEKRERHEERKRSEHKDEKVHREDRRRDREAERKEDDRERRHKERRHQEEKQKHHKEPRRTEEKEEEARRHRSHREEETVRDKHRERKNKEDRNPKDRTREKDKELQPSVLSDKQKAEETKLNEEEPEQEYEDDFEKGEYEDDFEEINESEEEEEEEKEAVPAVKQQLVEEKEELSPQRREEIKAIQRAMDEENKRVGALSRQNTAEGEGERPKWSRESDRAERQTPQRGKFMDFIAAKQREVNKKAASKQKKRSTELLRLIDLDFTLTSCLLDLPPVNEYDLYIKSFGNANTKQAYVQCNEDNADRDIQTEEIELSEKWTQHPPEHSGPCGDPNISLNTGDQNELSIDSKRLTAFLQSAAQVMTVLLEEDQAERNSLRKLTSQTAALRFSDGGLELNTKLPFLQGRHISLIHFSQVQKHTMISVHNTTSKSEPSATRLENQTLLCIWNIWEPSRPQKILTYESEVQCCCFSPGKAALVFAGTTVGSVVLWDLREHANYHSHVTFEDDEGEWTIRQPSFSTDAVMSASGHFSSVVSVEVAPSAVSRGQRSDVSLLASDEEAVGFQLASLDESGVLNFWVVVELPKADEAGSQTDLGLRPGGKVKLLHSSSLSVADRMANKTHKMAAALQTLRLKFHPTDSNHFFIGTNMGVVHHGTSHGLKVLPKFYRRQDGDEKPVEITSVCFSPFRHDLFLVGCGDGSVRLHAVSDETPLAEWSGLCGGVPGLCGGVSVVAAEWSLTRPAVFCVLDAASNVHVWDLLKNDREPVISENMNKDRMTAMALFGDSGKGNTYSGAALAHESGKILIQYFTNNLTRRDPAEGEKLNNLAEDF